MDAKQQLDLARSIITSALTPNNKTGMTAHELDLEIEALMGMKLELPKGCPSLEALIQRHFGDEFIGTPYNGMLKYRLVPKADTDYLLKLVARQDDKGSKPLYVAEKARTAALRGRGSSKSVGRGGRGGATRGGSSRGGRGAKTGNALQRLGPPVYQMPPRYAATPTSSYTNAPSRPASALVPDWGFGSLPSPLTRTPVSQTFSVPPPLISPQSPGYNTSAFQAAINQAFSNDISKRPASSMAQTSGTPVKPAENWGTKFKALFERYKACKEKGNSMEISCRLVSHSKARLASIDFPQSIEELHQALTAMITKCESEPKPEVNGTSCLVPFLLPNAFPPVGQRFLAIVSRLETFDRFEVQIEMPNSGRKATCPCQLAVTATDMAEAVKAAKDAIASCDNKVELLVKAHKTDRLEVDLFHVNNGKSLISYLVSKRLVFAKPEAIERSQSALPSVLPSPRRVVFKGTAVGPVSAKFVGRVSAVMTASIVAINAKSSMEKLIDIEDKLAMDVELVSTVRFEEIQKGACFIIKPSAQYCRAKVISVDASSKVATLRLIDHGADVKVNSPLELFHVPDVEDVVQTPPLAFYVDLNDLQHHIFQKASCSAVVQQELLGKLFQVQIIDRSGKRPRVDIYPVHAAVEAATSATKKIKEKILSGLTPNLQVGQETEVSIRYINWNGESGSASDIRIHVQIRGFAQEVLGAIEGELENLYEPGSKLVEASELSMSYEYAAPYEGTTYRCNLVSTEVDAKNRVSVFFFDYGNIDNVALSDLRLLEEKYSSKVLSNQAIATRLHGLPPSGKQWAVNADELVFNKFDPSGNSKLLAMGVDESDVYDVIFMKESGESLNEAWSRSTELFADSAATTAVIDSADQSDTTSTLVAEPVTTTAGGFDQATVELPAFNPDKSYDAAGQFFNACVIAFIAPGTLSCQLVPNEQFNEMITSMNEFYSDPKNQMKPNEMLKPGDVVVVYTGAVFCRAQIRNSGRYSYRVDFIDYASDHQIVKKDYVFWLEARFAAVPAMGFELQLSNAPSRSNSAIVEYGNRLAGENAFIKVFVDGLFTPDEALSCAITVKGKAMQTESDEDIGAHITSLL